jgi:hypothetical protein
MDGEIEEVIAARVELADGVVESQGQTHEGAALVGPKVVAQRKDRADPGGFDGMYDLYVLDPETGDASLLIAGKGAQIVEAVGVYPRIVPAAPVPPVYVSAAGEPNNQIVDPGTLSADLRLMDAQILASLLFQNTPTGRIIDPGVTSFDLYEDLPPDPGVTSLTSSSPYIAKDSFGSVWVKRRLVGTANAASDTDPSVHVSVPGGVPLVIHLPDTPISTQLKLPRWQREEIQLTPGEEEHEILPTSLFNGICANCHDAISGKPLPVSFPRQHAEDGGFRIKRDDESAPQDGRPSRQPGDVHEVDGQRQQHGSANDRARKGDVAKIHNDPTISPAGLGPI